MQSDMEQDRPNNSAKYDICVNILKAIADMSDILLSNESLDRAVNQALRILGTSVEADRLNVHKHQDDATGETLGCVVAQYEWLSDKIIDSQIEHPELHRIAYDGIEDCYQLFRQGKHWGGSIDTLPEPFRSGQLKLGVKATYAIPIMVEGKYWGIIGLDFCKQARQLEASEIEVLKTAANCIGSAIEKERILKEQEEARCEAFLAKQKATILEERDRLLALTTRTAKALLNNQNLELAIAKALRILGEGIETDRLVVMEHQNDPTGESLGHARILFEWHSPQVISQSHHPQLQQISYEGIEDWYERLNQGKAVGGTIEKLPEPLCSGQMEIGVKSTYAVPITIDEQYWGLLAFDDCQVARQRSETEISILKTTAACIGSAIEKNRVRQQQEQAQRNTLLEQQKAQQLKEHNQILEQRDRLLAATAEAANIISISEDFDLGIDRALEIIGETIDTDRVAVMEHYEDPVDKLSYMRSLYEWNSIYTTSQINRPELNKIGWAGVEDWREPLYRGQWKGGLVEKLNEPFRSTLKNIGAKSTCAIPIMVEGEFWGIVGIDDCREATRRTEAEISILQTAAACIGGAIEKERSQEAYQREIEARAKQSEQSNRVLTLRDRWLEATANAANKLLQIANLDEAMNAALKVLGENLDGDRVTIMQHIEGERESVRTLYEWDSPHAVSQMSHPKLNVVSDAGIEDWFVTLKAGGWIGGTIDELREPFRSGQAELGVKATYSVPIFVNNIYWGAICIDFCREPRHLSDPEIAVFKTAASCIGSAIYRQQIQTQQANAEKTIILERAKVAKEKARELTKVNALLNQSSIDLANASDLDSFLSQILRSISQQIGATTGHIFLYDEKSHTLTKRLSVRHGKITRGVAEYDCQLFRQPFSADITPGFEHLCQTQNVDLISTTNNSNSSFWWPETLEWHRQMGHQEATAIALMLGDRPLGLLGLGFTQEIVLEQEKLNLIRALANQVAIAIQLTKLAEQTKNSALIDERNRMAREIHDTLAQAFTGISLQLEAVRSILTTQPETAQERLLQAKKLAKEGIAEARRSVRALRPEVLEFGDLTTALHQLVAKMIAGTEIKTEVLIEGEPQSLVPEIEVNLFRIAQEAITNILRHAQATEVIIQLIYEPDSVHLMIQDNGKGFEPQLLINDSFGLMGMQERCDRHHGNLIINSKSDRGTEIIVTIPI